MKLVFLSVVQDAEATPNEHSGETDANAGITPAVESESKNKPAGIVLHHLNKSRSQRILWLLVSVSYGIETCCADPLNAGGIRCPV